MMIVSIDEFLAMTPEQQAQPGIEIDVRLDRRREQRRLWQDVQQEAAEQGVTPTDIVEGR